MNHKKTFAVAAIVAAFYSAAQADLASSVPELNSRPGAQYTLYLDFAGFNYSGTWDTATPGITPAYDDAVGSFTSAQQDDIRQVWARVAQNYMPWNINVTTVDPAVAAGQAGNDDLRKAFYDNTRYMSHTVIGGLGAWSGGGGVSFVSVAWLAGNEIDPGMHTNWVFSDTLKNVHPGTYNKAAAAATGHENGHALGLLHQSDVGVPGAPDQEYSRDGWTQFGDSYAGDGSYAPVMGVTYYTQRGAWRRGISADLGPGLQDDVSILSNDPLMNGQIEDGIGHSFATATALGSGAINPLFARGVIVSSNPNNPDVLGIDAYSKDVFSFQSSGSGIISLTVHDGTNFLDANTADPGATLNSDLEIFDSSQTLVATATRSSDTLSETFTGNLGAGTYYARVRSHGGYQSTFDPNAQYYDLGAYFITGSTPAVPEPASMAALAMGAVALIRRKRKN